MNNEEEMQVRLAGASTLVEYNKPLDLVAVRRDPVAFPRIGATPLDEVVKRVTRMVYGALLYRGQEANPEKVQYIATTLAAEILNDTEFGLRHLSWAELGMVVRRAVLGGRELYGVTVASLYGALVDYAKGEGHEAVKRAAQSVL